MAIQIQGSGGSIAEIDGSTYRALRVTLRPVEYGTHGQYRAAGISDTMAAGLAAGSEIYQARWTASPQLALIWGVMLDGFSGGTPAFTAGFTMLALSVARNWTVNGSGGLQTNLSGNNGKLRTSMATSLMGPIRFSSTAALGTGTKTIDPSPEGEIAFAIATTTWASYTGQVCLYGSASLEDGGNPAPIVLAQNEGLVVTATVPATGTWQFGITLAWSEVDSY